MIRSYNPCGQAVNSYTGWDKLTRRLGTTDPDASVSLSQILAFNGIEDAVWALRCFDYKKYCLFLAEVAESVYPYYRNVYPDDTVVRRVIHNIRWHYDGTHTSEQLYSSAIDVIRGNNRNTTCLSAQHASDTVAYAAIANVSSSSYTIAHAVAATIHYYAACFVDNKITLNYADVIRQDKFMEIELMFKKHFCTEENGK